MAAIPFRTSLDDSAFTAGCRRMEKTADESARRIGGIFDKIGGGFSSAMGVGGAGGVAGTAGLSAIALSGDKATASLNRLSAATGNLEDAKAAYSGLLEVSSLTGASIDDATTAFARFAIAGRQVGATNDQLTTLVGMIQKVGVISGSTTQEMSAASVQLGQSLASGRLQGDELRSIMENMPLLAEQLAKQLGVSVGELRAMGTAGQLTTERVFPALLKSTDEINRKFAEMDVTMSRAWGTFLVEGRNALAAIDKQIGLSSGISGLLGAISSGNWQPVLRAIGGAPIRTGATSLAQENAARNAMEQRKADAERQKQANAKIEADALSQFEDKWDSEVKQAASKNRASMEYRAQEEERQWRENLAKESRQFDEEKAQQKADALNKFARADRAAMLGGLRGDLADAQDRQGAAADAFENANAEMRAFNRMSPDERRQANRDAADERRIAAREARMAKSGARDARAGAGERLADIAEAKKALDLSEASINKLVAEINKLIVAP